MKVQGYGDLMVKMSASQPMYHRFNFLMSHKHASSYNTSTGLFQEADWGVIQISCQNLLHNQAYQFWEYQDG